jgi:hypothetical protein
VIKFNRSPLVIDAVTAGATGGIALLASVILIKLVAPYDEAFAIGTIAPYTLGISIVVWKLLRWPALHSLAFWQVSLLN